MYLHNVNHPSFVLQYHNVLMHLYIRNIYNGLLCINMRPKGYLLCPAVLQCFHSFFLNSFSPVGNMDNTCLYDDTDACTHGVRSLVTSLHRSCTVSHVDYSRFS